MVALAYNDMEMALTLLLRSSDPSLKYIFGLLDELAVQVDSVGRDVRIVFPEDVLGRLTVVVLGLLAQLVRLGAVAALVGIVGSRVRLASLVAEIVVVALCVRGRAVVEGWVNALARH